VTSIAAAVQRPAPKLDRDVTLPLQDDEGPEQGGPDCASPFGAVLRAVAGGAGSGAPAAPAAPAALAASPDSAKRPSDDAGETRAGVEAQDAAEAAALLAELLNAALPTLGATSSNAAQSAARTGSAASGPIAEAGSITRVPPAQDRAPAPTAESHTPAPNLPRDTPGAAPLAGSAPPAIAVLGREVHFKPVLRQDVAAAANPGTPPAAADPGTSPAAANKGTAFTAADPGTPSASAAFARVTLQEAPVSVAATAGPLPLPAEPDQRGTPVPTSPAAAQRDPRRAMAPEDPRAVSGVEKSALTALEHRSETPPERSPSPDQAAPALSLGISLPTIASAITAEIERASRAAPREQGAAAAGAVPGNPLAPDGPLRVLRIQLRPEELGTVTVELRLTNGQLETHLRAARPETAALLHKDAAILTDLLRQAHAQAEVVVGPVQSSEAGTGSGGSTPQGQSAFAGGGTRPDQGGDRQRQAAQRQTAGRREGERADEAVRPRDGGIYL
jgi:chemotaxis protein MotD